MRRRPTLARCCRPLAGETPARHFWCCWRISETGKPVLEADAYPVIAYMRGELMAEAMLAAGSINGKWFK